MCRIAIASLAIVCVAFAPAAAAEPPKREGALCAVGPDLRIAVLYPTSGEQTANTFLVELARWDCLHTFQLPSSIPAAANELPEGATRIADRIGVDWIIVVAEASKGYVTARLVELSNLTVLAAQHGTADVVARALFKPVIAEAGQSTVRVTLVIDPLSFQELKLLEQEIRKVPGIKEPGSGRFADGRGTITVVFEGRSNGLAEALTDRPVGKSFLSVRTLRRNRLELGLSAVKAVDSAEAATVAPASP